MQTPIRCPSLPSHPHPSPPPTPPLVLPQWHVKDPGYSAKSAGGTLHLNMRTPLTQVSWLCCPGILWEFIAEENEFTRDSLGNTRPLSCQLAEPLWTDPGLKSGIGGCQPPLTKEINKKRRPRTNRRTSPQILASVKKAIIIITKFLSSLQSATRKMTSIKCLFLRHEPVMTPFEWRNIFNLFTYQSIIAAACHHSVTSGGMTSTNCHGWVSSPNLFRYWVKNTARSTKKSCKNIHVD